jgi:hypothetical protein
VPPSVEEVLTRRQRNNIFEALQTKGVDPARCRLIVKRKALAVEILHEPTGSWFQFILNTNRYSFVWRVQDGPGAASENRTREWGDVLDQLEYWAGEVHYVTETPDFWAELQQVPEILAAAQSDDASNAPFAPDEQAEISTRIDQVKGVVRREHPELMAEQLAAIEQGLDVVKEATTRVGRKDWVTLANGALLSLVVNDLVPPHVVQGVFNMLITGIGHLFGIGGPPTMIST